MKENEARQMAELYKSGIAWNDVVLLRGIAMSLHDWYERECGAYGGCIERDEDTGKTYWLDSQTMRRRPIADRETGRLKALSAIMEKYPTVPYEVQKDPRGSALTIGGIRL